MKEESFLAISGYDPSGGAGVIADSQVSSYFGIPFCSLLTCISNQDTSSVHTVQPMDKSFYPLAELYVLRMCPDLKYTLTMNKKEYQNMMRPDYQQ